MPRPWRPRRAPRRCWRSTGCVVAFPARSGMVLAVDEVSFRLEHGRTLGARRRIRVRQVDDAARDPGLVPYPGRGHRGLHPAPRPRAADPGRRSSSARCAAARSRSIFQDPNASLDPVFTVGDQIVETLRVRRADRRRRRRAAGGRAAGPGGHPVGADAPRAVPAPAVGRDAPARDDRAGDRHRARACCWRMSRRPRWTSRSRTRSSGLLADIRAETGMGMILVSHDAGVIAQSADEVVVMYAGRLLEAGHARRRAAGPTPSRTRAGSCGAIPSLDGPPPRSSASSRSPGQPPDIGALPPGCPVRAPLPPCPPGLRRRCRWSSTPTPPGHGSTCPFVGRTAA